MKPNDWINNGLVTEQRLAEVLKTLKTRIDQERWGPWTLRLLREDQAKINTLIDELVKSAPTTKLLIKFAGATRRRPYLLPEDLRFICNLVLGGYANFCDVVEYPEGKVEDDLLGFYARASSETAASVEERMSDSSEPFAVDGYNLVLQGLRIVDTLESRDEFYANATAPTYAFFEALFTFCSRHLPESTAWEIYEEIGSLFTE